MVTVQNLLDAQVSGNRDLQRLARERLLLWGIDQDQIDDILRTSKPITHLTIRSPISGHVIKKYQFEGEYVEEGTRLFDMADLSTVWIEAQVYEDEVAFLTKGLAVTASAKSFPNREFKGNLSFVHPHLDTSTRTLKVRFDMDNPGHDLRPGMYTTVRLHVPVTRLDLLPADADTKRADAFSKGQVLAVPERAVIDTGSHKFVYRQAEQDIYEGLAVELGPRCGKPLSHNPRPAGRRPGGDHRFVLDRRRNAPRRRYQFHLLRRQCWPPGRPCLRDHDGPTLHDSRRRVEAQGGPGQTQPR